jgi:hypothetical protein
MVVVVCFLICLYVALYEEYQMNNITILIKNPNSLQHSLKKRENIFPSIRETKGELISPYNLEYKIFINNDFVIKSINSVLNKIIIFQYIGF